MKEYTYDYNRSEYMADYYQSRREELNEKAKQRYRKMAIEKTIADLKNREANYSKEQIAERLLRANDKVKRNTIPLNARQTIVVSIIMSNLKRAEIEYYTTKTKNYDTNNFSRDLSIWICSKLLHN